MAIPLENAKYREIYAVSPLPGLVVSEGGVQPLFSYSAV